MLIVEGDVSMNVRRFFYALLFIILLSFVMIVGAVDKVEIRGAVAGTIDGQSNLVGGNTFTWNPQNFAGFYYDIKKDIGTETLKISITEGNKLSGDSPYGVVYTTSTKPKDYEFEDWGSYKIMGFMAERYFPRTTSSRTGEATR
jgi:hypothetical protein